MPLAQLGEFMGIANGTTLKIESLGCKSFLSLELGICHITRVVFAFRLTNVKVLAKIGLNSIIFNTA